MFISHPAVLSNAALFVKANKVSPAVSPEIDLTKKKEEIVMRLPPLGLIGLMDSARSLAGYVTICSLINRGFSRGGNILCA